MLKTYAKTSCFEMKRTRRCAFVLLSCIFQSQLVLYDLMETIGQVSRYIETQQPQLVVMDCMFPFLWHARKLGLTNCGGGCVRDNFKPSVNVSSLVVL